MLDMIKSLVPGFYGFDLTGERQRERVLTDNPEVLRIDED